MRVLTHAVGHPTLTSIPYDWVGVVPIPGFTRELFSSESEFHKSCSRMDSPSMIPISTIIKGKIIVCVAILTCYVLLFSKEGTR